MYGREGSVEKIAARRGFAPITIMGHLLYAYEHGGDIDISTWLSPEARDVIQGALPLFEKPYVLESIMEHFNGQYNWDEIKWAIADAERKARLDA